MVKSLESSSDGLQQQADGNEVLSRIQQFFKSEGGDGADQEASQLSPSHVFDSFRQLFDKKLRYPDIRQHFLTTMYNNRPTGEELEDNVMLRRQLFDS